MSLATLIEIKLVGTFALFLGLLVWQLVSVRRALKSDRRSELRPFGRTTRDAGARRHRRA